MAPVISQQYHGIYDTKFYIYESKNVDDYCIEENDGYFLYCAIPRPIDTSGSSAERININLKVSLVELKNIPISSYSSFKLLKDHNPGSIQNLTIVNASMAKLEENAFGNLPLLQELSLAHNLLKDAPDQLYPNFCKIKKLDMSYNQITSIKLDNFVKNLKYLEYLNLEGNLIASIPSSISKLPLLSDLILSNNPFRAISEDNSISNTRLQTLKFQKMPELQLVGDCAFCNFPQLTEISFSKSVKLSTIHENAFGYITMRRPLGIRHFHIDGCQVGTLPEKLLEWKSLETLFIDFNHFTCDCKLAWLINDLKSNSSRHLDKLWHTHTLKAPTTDTLICYNPPALFGKSLLTLDGSFCKPVEPPTTPTYSRWLVGLLIAVFGTVAFGIFGFWAWHKGYCSKNNWDDPIENVNFSSKK